MLANSFWCFVGLKCLKTQQALVIDFFCIHLQSINVWCYMNGSKDMHYQMHLLQFNLCMPWSLLSDIVSLRCTFVGDKTNIVDFIIFFCELQLWSHHQSWLKMCGSSIYFWNIAGLFTNGWCKWHSKNWHGIQKRWTICNSKKIVCFSISLFNMLVVERTYLILDVHQPWIIIFPFIFKKNI